MAAPDVASQATSSDEFQKLNELVARSDELIAQAEAWARGTKNNMDVGPASYIEDTNVTAENFSAKKPFLFIKSGDDYVPLDSSATFDASETYYALSVGSDNNAKYYSEQAQIAKESIEDLTVSSTTLAAGASASVEKTVDQQTGIVNLAFGIPQGIQGIPGVDGIDGERGPSTVWVGVAEPSDEAYTVWLNPEGTKTPLLVTANQVSYSSTSNYDINTIGSTVHDIEDSMEDIQAIASVAEAAAERAEAAAEEMEAALEEIDGKITSPALPTNTGFLSVVAIQPATPGEPATPSYYWTEKISYNTDLVVSTLPKINNRTLQGNLTLSDLGIAPRTGSTVYYTFPSNGVPSTDLADEVNASLNLADSAIQVIHMNGADFEPTDGTVNLGTILTADDNANVGKNYLDNSWFSVNQKGVEAYNGTAVNIALAGTYVCDRWKVLEDEGLGNRSIAVSNNSLYISAAGLYDATKSFSLGQIIDDDVWRILGGRNTTASINFSVDNSTYKTEEFTFTCPAYNTLMATPIRYQIIDGCGWGLQISTTTVEGKNYLVFSMLWAGNAWGTTMSDSPLYIKKTKLELGIIGTLDLEGAPVYHDELEKCQRYFRYYGGKTSADSVITVIGSGIAATSDILEWNIPFQHDMVANPSLISSVDLVVNHGVSAATATAGAITSAALASTTFFEGVDCLYLQTAASGLTLNTPYYVVLPATATVSEGDEVISYLAFSAEP